MEQEIKKLTKAVDKLARELKRYNDTKNAGPAGVDGSDHFTKVYPTQPPGATFMDPTQLPEVKVSLGQRNEGRTFANMLARAMNHDEKMDALKNAYFKDSVDRLEAAREAAQVKLYRSKGGKS